MSGENRTEFKTDVLIIGAGPSGLMAAYWMARCGVKARIVDKRETKVFLGHADGLRPRTLEIFDSMGFQHRVLHEACTTTEVHVWGPDDNGGLVRQSQWNMTEANKSPFQNSRLSQGRLERFILDTMREHSDLRVDRGIITESLEYDDKLEDNADAYPITVKLRTLSQEELSTPKSTLDNLQSDVKCEQIPRDEWEDLLQRGNRRQKFETVKARYLIGCDGAHSWTRKQLGISVEGSSTDHIWGVVDVRPVTDFPDIRRVSVVSTAAGTLLLIPRERGLVRFYVPMHVCEAGASDRFDRSSITPELIRSRVKKMLSPFTFDFDDCDWFTVYGIGQRIATQLTKGDRIFLAGDAVHTHSPKMGLGMNQSLQDGFNVGWKVALAVAGTVKPEILKTYDMERHPLAKMLVEFDRNWVTTFLDEEPAQKDAKAKKMATMAKNFDDFAHGWKVYYPASNIVCKSSDDAGLAVAANMIPGERVLPVKLRNQADGSPRWTTRLLEADGRFRILVLAGDMCDPIQKQRVETLSQALKKPSAFGVPLLERYFGIPGQFESPICLVTIHCAAWNQVELVDFPDPLRSFNPTTGYSYDSIWCDDASVFDRYCDGKAYEKWAVDRLLGALVVIRPDQYVGWVGRLEDLEGVANYFDGVLVKKPTGSGIEAMI